MAGLVIGLIVVAIWQAWFIRRLHRQLANANSFVIGMQENARPHPWLAVIGGAGVITGLTQEQVTMAAELNQPASQIQSIQESVLEQDVAK